MGRYELLATEIIYRTYVILMRTTGRASTICLHMAVMIGGGNLTKEETKSFEKIE